MAEVMKINRNENYPSKLKCNCCGIILDNLKKRSIKSPDQVKWIIFKKEFICKNCNETCKEKSDFCSKKGLITIKNVLNKEITGKKNLKLNYKNN